MDSILLSVKKVLGGESVPAFDEDIIIHINSVLCILNQLGVGPTNGFIVENEEATWSEFLKGFQRLDLVKSYMYLKVKMLFDPPTSAAAIESSNKMIQEFEWRIVTQVENNTILI